LECPLLATPAHGVSQSFNASIEEESVMLSVENNELLTRVGPGTPMGMLMRHYWQPVCAVDDLLRSPFRTHAVKVLGEELVV